MIEKLGITPGPWYSDYFGNVTSIKERKGLKKLLPNFHIVCKCDQGNYQANAKLIAAAPEMLEALIDECILIEEEKVL